jgi:hypothetical protein
MRRAARQDSNHRAIVGALKQAGASVLDLSSIGGGCPDLCVGYRGRNWLLEVKDGAKSPSRRRLTDDQVEFKATWRGHWAIVYGAADAVAIISRADP